MRGNISRTNIHMRTGGDDLWFKMDHKLYTILCFLGKLTFLLTKIKFSSLIWLWGAWSHKIYHLLMENSTSSKCSVVGWQVIYAVIVISLLHGCSQRQIWSSRDFSTPSFSEAVNILINMLCLVLGCYVGIFNIFFWFNKICFFCLNVLRRLTFFKTTRGNFHIFFKTCYFFIAASKNQQIFGK